MPGPDRILLAPRLRKRSGSSVVFNKAFRSTQRSRLTRITTSKVVRARAKQAAPSVFVGSSPSSSKLLRRSSSAAAQGKASCFVGLRRAAQVQAARPPVPSIGEVSSQASCSVFESKAAQVQAARPPVPPIGEVLSQADRSAIKGTAAPLFCAVSI